MCALITSSVMPHVRPNPAIAGGAGGQVGALARRPQLGQDSGQRSIGQAPRHEAPPRISRKRWTARKRWRLTLPGRRSRAAATSAVDNSSTNRSTSTSRWRSGSVRKASQIRRGVSSFSKRSMGSRSGGRHRDLLDAIAPAPEAHPPARSTAVTVGVDGDPREPGRPVARGLRLHLRSVSFHEHVLNDVAGLLGVADEQLAEPEQTRAVGIHERLMFGPVVHWTGSSGLALCQRDERALVDRGQRKRLPGCA